MKTRFPWFIFLQFFFTQFLVFNFLFFVIAAFLTWYYSIGIEIFLTAITLYVVGSAILAALTAHRFSMPVRRVLNKALRISSKKWARNYVPSAEEIFDDEPGEYSELERALDRISRKMTKRKEQLQREREESQAFMSSVQEGLLSIGLDERLLYFNSQFAAHFLDQSQMSSPHLSLTDVFRNPEIYDAFKKVIAEGITQKVSVRINTKVDNLPRDYAIALTPLRRDTTHEIYGVIALLYDITDIKKAERIRIEFVSNASHELRTPLTSVKGYVDMLKEDFQNGRYQQSQNFLDIVSRNVNRLIELVNDMLSLSSLEQGSELNIELINPLLISEAVVKDLEVIASEKNQMIRVIGEVPPFMADARKVEQVLRNLVSNAIKYIPEQGQIQIRWEKASSSDVILRVIDNGPGISEEHHERLFERFYRVDKGRARESGGTGLGLAIVKHIMQSHGGSVRVQSHLGQGTEFICLFPRIDHGKSVSLH